MILKFISELMDDMQIPYQYGEWNDNLKKEYVIDSTDAKWECKNVPNPYVVGEYVEIESLTMEECGYQETNFLLTVTGTSYIDLEKVKNKIRNAMPIITVLEDKSSIAVYYINSLNVPTGDAELKRLQINLRIKEWRC